MSRIWIRANRGVQVFIEGGSREFKLLAPQEPGESVIRVTAGCLARDDPCDFSAGSAPPDCQRITRRGTELAQSQHQCADAGATSGWVRAAVDQFVAQLEYRQRRSGGARRDIFEGAKSGAIICSLWGTTRIRIRRRGYSATFSRISSTRYTEIPRCAALMRSRPADFTCASTKAASWLLYGDFTTQSTSDARQLSNYNRSLTGVKEHYENPQARGQWFRQQRQHHASG